MRKVCRFPSIWWACLAMTLAAPAAADEGLKVSAASSFWPTLPTRVRLNATLLESLPAATLLGAGASWRAPVGASVLGDYYLFADTDSFQPQHDGLRASSALLIRSPGVSLTELAMSSRSVASSGSALRQGLPAATAMVADPTGDGFTTLPYLGIGYSSLSSRSGWGFWADVGVVVQNPGSALGLGRTLSGNQGVDDLMRELRLSPMLQLGVNYSF